MKLPRPNRIPAITLGVLALLVAAAGGAFAAGTGGGTITACVHHKGGGLYKARKCAKHDSKLTWNMQGVPGQNGMPGANGAVAGYSASYPGPVDFTNLDANHAATIMTKNLPAGSFIVSAKTVLDGSTIASGEFTDDICTLSDGSSSDTAEWSAPVTSPAHLHTFTDGTVSMNIAVTSGSPSTVVLGCYNNMSPQANFFTTAKNTQIDAIQTSSNS